MTPYTPPAPQPSISTPWGIVGILVAKGTLGCIMSITGGLIAWSWYLTWPWSGLVLSTFIIWHILRGVDNQTPKQ